MRARLVRQGSVEVEHVAPFAQPLLDTIAPVVRHDAVFPPATREIVRIAREMPGT